MTTKAEPTSALQEPTVIYSDSEPFKTPLLTKNKSSLSSTSLCTQSTVSPSESSYSVCSESITTLGERCISFTPVSSSWAETLGLADYSAEEIERCWYCREEYRTMAEDSINMRKRMEMGKLPKRKDSYRGLETWTEDGERLLGREICNAIDIVLDEQERQWDEKCHDEELIAVLYQAATHTSNVLALSIGIVDECGVQADLDQARSDFLAYEKPKPAEEEPVKERAAPVKRKCADPPGRKIEKAPSIHEKVLRTKPKRRVKPSGTKKTKNGDSNSSSRSRSVFDNSPHPTTAEQNKKVSRKKLVKKKTEGPKFNTSMRGFST
jgi:hypothetical protein